MTLMLRDLPLDGRGPAYEQIYRALRSAILSGRVRRGIRLPATRPLAADLGVSRTTVLSAYDQLLAEGYAEARVGSGTYVALRPSLPARTPAPAGGSTPARSKSGDVARPARPRLSSYGRRILETSGRERYDAEIGAPMRFDFRPCVPELERIPDESWRRTLARHATHAPPRSFDYGNPSGTGALRRQLAAYLARARGVHCDPRQIIVTGGVTQALDLTARLFLDPGDAVLLEEPHYLGARRAFDAHGAELRTAPVDDEGLQLAGISRSQLDSCRLAYVTPSHHFPSGAVMSLSRRLELLHWAERSSGFVVEDDYDSEFRYSGRAIEALKSLDEHDRVIYMGTFSKTLLPALRIAYLVLPEALVELFRAAKWLADWASPSFEQLALARFIESGDFERHLRRARTLYGRSRAALTDALREQLGDRCTVRDSGAGLHLPVRLNGVPRRLEARLVAAARERDVGIYPATPCYVNPPPELELVLGFTRLDEDDIRTGTERLRRALESVTST